MSDWLNVFSRAARRYESVRWPGAVLVVLIIAGYGWTLGWGPMIDDFRHLRVMREYREGSRKELGLYRFLRGGGENRAQRAAGYYPWWVSDDVRYQHSRPIAERWLYGQFVVFGEQAAGYRVVSLAMYAAGVVIVLRLFRRVLADERTARWAALIFAVAASHAVAVGFISMQCDLLGLILVGGAMCLAVRFVRDGGWRWAAGCTALYALALGAKESSLPAAVFPLLAAWALGCDEKRAGSSPARSMWRRGVAVTGAMLAVGASWLVVYTATGYGANNSMMLDPLRDPAHYFAELWTRAGALLATWLIPVNPFLFYLRPLGERAIPFLACVGLATLAVVAWLASRHGARATAWGVWALAFMPLLVCTPPDDRNLMLPSIGFAALAALWMTGGRGGGERLQRIPLALFVLLQIPVGAVVLGSLQYITTYPFRTMAAGLGHMGPDSRTSGTIIFVNVWDDSSLLFSQDCMDYLLHRDRRIGGVRVAYLCDIRDPRVTRVDERTLRIEGVTENLLAGFIGKMGRTRARDWVVGDEYDAGEFVAKIVEMNDGQIRAVEFRFDRLLDDAGYCFLRCGPGGTVEREDFSRQSVARPLAWSAPSGRGGG